MPMWIKTTSCGRGFAAHLILSEPFILDLIHSTLLTFVSGALFTHDLEKSHAKVRI